jgi:hypothetical protein
MVWTSPARHLAQGRAVPRWLSLKTTSEGIREPVRLRPSLKVEIQNDALMVEAIGGERVFEFEPLKPTIVTPLSDTEFYVPGRYHTRIAFTKDAIGKVVGAILNPGRWEQRGIRTN